MVEVPAVQKPTHLLNLTATIISHQTRSKQINHVRSQLSICNAERELPRISQFTHGSSICARLAVRSTLSTRSAALFIAPAREEPRSTFPSPVPAVFLRHPIALSRSCSLLPSPKHGRTIRTTSRSTLTSLVEHGA